MRILKIFPMPGKHSTAYLSNSFIIFCFSISSLFLLYLVLITRMIIVNDSISYQDLGQMIYKEGWTKYFVTGPNREPLYPFLISLAMNVADRFSLHYQDVQKFFHLDIFLTTQFLVYRILKKLHARPIITGAVIIYMGVISPILVNSTLILAYEILTFPLLIWTVFAASFAWRVLPAGQLSKTLPSAVLLGSLFILITFVKGIHEYIFPIFLLPFFALGIRAIIRQERNIVIHTAIFLILSSSLFYSVIINYKLLNKKYNGIYTLTDRGPWALYASAERRTEEMPFKRILAVLTLNVLGPDACSDIWGQDELFYWDHNHLDERGARKMHELMKKIPREKIYPALIEASKERIMVRPFQFSLLAMIESYNMFSWEPPRVGFTTYPDWMQKYLDFTPFRMGLRLSVALASLCSFAVCFSLVARNRRILFQPDTKDHGPTILIFFCLMIMIPNIILYSPFMILERFALPLAPLYLILIAYSLNRVLGNQTISTG